MHWFSYPRNQTADGAERTAEAGSAPCRNAVAPVCRFGGEGGARVAEKPIKGCVGQIRRCVPRPQNWRKAGLWHGASPHHPPLQRIPALSGLPNLTLYAKWKSPTPSCPYNPALKNILLGLNKNISQNLCQVSVLTVSPFPPALNCPFCQLWYQNLESSNKVLQHPEYPGAVITASLVNLSF